VIFRGCFPEPNPVGFLLQDDNSILTYNMARANRINHVIDRPRVSLHFDGDGTGGDIVVFTGTASRADEIPLPHANQAWLAKYGDGMARQFGSVETRWLCALELGAAAHPDARNADHGAEDDDQGERRVGGELGGSAGVQTAAARVT
jgi:PPOX class probable F420-dependent enzyme